MTDHQIDMRFVHMTEAQATGLPLASGMPAFVSDKDILRMGNSGETNGGIVVGPTPKVLPTVFQNTLNTGSTLKKPFMWVPTGWTVNLLAFVSYSAGATWQFSVKYASDLSTSGTAVTGLVTTSTTTGTVTSGGSILVSTIPAGSVLFYFFPASQPTAESVLIEMYFRWAPA